MSKFTPIDFSDTQIAFASKTNGQLKKALWLFKFMNSKKMVGISIFLANTALKIKLPIKWAIKYTIFEHFCGGETIIEAETTINDLGKFNVGTILDYSVEGLENDKSFEDSTNEIISTINRAKNDKNIPFAVFKMTGLAQFALLEKINSGENLTSTEEVKFDKVKNRLTRIFDAAKNADVPVFVDAEETWIQLTIDQLVEEFMPIYNSEKALIYNTAQMYRHDRLDYLKIQIEKAKSESYFYGIKLVRGAYMEKERDRAAKMQYTSPINPTKEASDICFDNALKLCVEHINHVAICAGTHNEESTLLLTRLMTEGDIPKNHPHVYFSQLLGMSDNLSFNLSKAGFNVVKYVPYGPVAEVLPYLIRRAEENSSMAGQMSREYLLLKKEVKRRKGN